MRNDSYHTFDHEMNDVQKLIDIFFVIRCYMTYNIFRREVKVNKHYDRCFLFVSVLKHIFLQITRSFKNTLNINYFSS